MSLKSSLKVCLSLLLLVPMMAFAHHLLSITATTPFPASVQVSSTTTGIFTVTNLASQISVIAIDQSILPTGRGMRVSASTCGGLMGPGQSCQLTVSFTAPATAQNVAGEIRMWAKPSADGIRYPFSVTVVAPPNYTITPQAGANGSIAPNTPQTVSQGSDLTFTATPNAGFQVNQWFLDGTAVQTGGTTYNLVNINANHTVSVTFSVQQLTVTPVAGANGTISPAIPQTVNPGSNLSFTATPNATFQVNQWLLDGVAVQTGGTTYNLVNITANHTVTVTFSLQQFTVTPVANANGTISPATPQTVNLGSNLTFTATPSSGFEVDQWFLDGVLAQTGGTTYALNNITANHIVSVTFVQVTSVAVGTTFQTADVNNTPLVYTSTDSGASWSLSPTPEIPGTQGIVSLFGVTCLNGDCVAVGEAHSTGFVLATPVIYTSTDNGISWSAPNISFPTPGGSTRSSLFSVSCVGAKCSAVGRTTSATRALAYASSNFGTSWTGPSSFNAPAGSNFYLLNGVSCVGTNCTAVGFSITPPSTRLPLAYTSTDNGVTWSGPSSITTTGPTTFMEVFGVSCVGAQCTAVGEENTDTAIVLNSADSGVTWTQAAALPPSGTLGILLSVQCINTHCVTVGWQSDGVSQLPLVYTSDDSGFTWVEISASQFTFPGSQTQAKLSSISCTGSVCSAVGTSYNAGGANDQPIAYRSADGGTTWSLSDIANLPSSNTLGELFGVASGNGSGSVNGPITYAPINKHTSWQQQDTL